MIFLFYFFKRRRAAAKISSKMACHWNIRLLTTEAGRHEFVHFRCGYFRLFFFWYGGGLQARKAAKQKKASDELLAQKALREAKHAAIQV